MKPKLKNDRYKKTRGGSSRLLNILCGKCDLPVCLYQKDGPGNLWRMYHDRIIDTTVPIHKKDFSCHNGHLLGVQIVYKKEDRQAFRLVPDAVKKKLVKVPTVLK